MSQVIRGRGTGKRINSKILREKDQEEEMYRNKIRERKLQRMNGEKNCNKDTNKRGKS